MQTVTVEEQKRQGLRSERAPFVPVIKRTPAPLPLHSNVAHTLAVTPSATQHVEVRTNAVDRALGFAIETAPLTTSFAVVVVGICVVGFGVPLYSLASLLIAFTVFTVTYTIAYLHRLAISPEGVCLFEAQEKWGILRDEHRQRWAHYDNLERSE